MIDLILIYAFIVGMSLLNWAFNRFALARGLSVAFLKARQQNNFDYFFELHKTPYIKTLIWAALYIVLVAFCAGRLLYFLNLWSIETALVGLALVAFFARERVHYTTAIFVVARVRQE